MLLSVVYISNNCQSLSRGVGDISGDELEVSPSELVVLLPPDVGRPPLTLGVGWGGQVGVQPGTRKYLELKTEKIFHILLELIWRRREGESPSKLGVVGGGEAWDGLLQGDGAQQDGEGDHQVKGGT